MANIRLVDREGNFGRTARDRDRLEKIKKSIPLEERIIPHAHVVVVSRLGCSLIQVRKNNKLFAPGAEEPIHGGNVSEPDLLKYEENPEENISPYHVGAVRECGEELGIHIEPQLLGDPIAEAYIEPVDSKGITSAAYIKLFGIVYDQSKYGYIIIDKREVKDAYFKSVKHLSREDLAKLVGSEFAEQTLREIIRITNEVKTPLMRSMYYTIRDRGYLVGQYDSQGILHIITEPDKLDPEEEALAIIEARQLLKRGLFGMGKRGTAELSHIAQINLEINPYAKPRAKDSWTINAYDIDHIGQLEELARVFSQTYGMNTELRVDESDKPRKIGTYLLSDLNAHQRRTPSLTQIVF